MERKREREKERERQRMERIKEKQYDFAKRKLLTFGPLDRCKKRQNV